MVIESVDRLLEALGATVDSRLPDPSTYEKRHYSLAEVDPAIAQLALRDDVPEEDIYRERRFKREWMTLPDGREFYFWKER